MKKTDVKAVRLNIKRQTLDKIIDAFLLDEFPTRQSVSLSCGTTVPTVNKVAKSLIEARFMGTKAYKDENSSKRELHYTLSNRISIAVIDLSSPTFTMSVINKNRECTFFESYICDIELLFEDNLELFLSNCIAKLEKIRILSYELCILYSDNASSSIKLSTYSPSIENKELIEAIIAKIMRRSVLLHITLSDAFGSAKGYNLCKFDKSACYLNFDSSPSLIYTDENGFTLSAYPEKLLFDSSKTLKERLQRPLTHADLTKIICQLTNFIVSAYNPRTIYIATRRDEIDKKFIQDYTRTFMPADYLPPEIIFDNEIPGLLIRSAAHATLSKLIKSTIKTPDE